MSDLSEQDRFFRLLEGIVRDVLRSERDVPVRINADPKTSIEDLQLRLPTHGTDMTTLANKLTSLLLAAPTTATPRFLNQLYGGRDWPSVLGEMLVPVVNNSMYTYKVAGPHILIEQILVEKMGALMGYEHPGGIFSPGGSLSNLTAIVLARNEADSSVRDGGVSATGHRIYTSSVSHYSISKGANLAGVGRANVVKVEVDAAARMLPEALDKAIAQDLEQGFLPTMVNVTLGTTVEGAFDPIGPIADICERRGVWLHLDAAWGGSMVLSPDHCHLFEESGRADSITWDVHKMMGVPLTSSVLLTRDQAVLTKHLSENADYLFQEDTDWLNPGTRSIQCGRRNDVLKVWAGWQFHGDVGYAERLQACRKLVEHAVQTIRKHPRLELSIEPESLNVCFSVEDRCSKQICSQLHEEGRIMVGYGNVHGETIVRVVFLNPDMTTDDVDEFFRHVLEVSA